MNTIIADEWNDYAHQRVIDLAKQDADYQQLLGRCEELSPEYLRILHSLSPEQQQILEEYISCCEEMEYRLAQLAYDFGKRDPALKLRRRE